MTVDEFRNLKKKTIQAAKELCYPEYVIRQLKAAKNDIELTRIMIDARHNMK